MKREGISWNADLQKCSEIADDRYSTRKKIAPAPQQ